MTLQQQARRNRYDAVGLLVEEVETTFSLHPTPLTDFAVQLAVAYRRCVLKVLVLQKSLKGSLQRLSHSLAPYFPLDLLPLLRLLLPQHFPYPTCSRLFHLFLTLLLVLLTLLLRPLFLNGSPFLFVLEPMHPSLSQFTAQQSLIAGPPVIDRRH